MAIDFLTKCQYTVNGDMMSKEIQFLTELICTILYSKPLPEVSLDLDWDRVRYLILNSKLSGLVYESLEQMQGVPKELLDTLRAKYKKSVKRSVLQGYYADEILRRLEERGVPCLPMKGIVVRRLYPQVYMRKMTDVDILVAADKIEIAREIMRELEFEEHRDDAYYKDKGVTVEIQRWFFPKLYDGYFDIDFSKFHLQEGKSYTYEMNTNDFYIYLIAHMASHFMYEGLGVRAVIDVRLYLDAYEKSMDRDYIAGEFKKLGLFTFAQQLEKLSAVWFLDEELDEFSQELGCYILKSGYSGSPETRATLQIMHEGKRGKAIVAKIIPPYTTMVSYYPILKKLPLLLPLTWATRWLTVLCTRRKNIKKIKDLSRVGEEKVQRVDALYEKLKIKHLLS